MRALTILSSLILLLVSGAALVAQTSVHAGAQTLAALGVAASPGYSAQGTATFADGESGPFTLVAFGPDHCRIAIDLSQPGRPRLYQAVASGKSVRMESPTGLDLPLALGPGLGCPLLPQGLAWASLGRGYLAVRADAGSGLPSAASWTAGSHALQVGYSGWQKAGSAAYPARVVLQRDKNVVLTLSLSSFTPLAAMAPEFVLPPPPPPRGPVTPHRGGGQ